MIILDEGDLRMLKGLMHYLNHAVSPCTLSLSVVVTGADEPGLVGTITEGPDGIYRLALNADA